jgi:hypothetical protein
VCGRLALGALVVAAASLGPAGACRAEGLIISAPAFTATPGSSGSFDVLLSDSIAAHVSHRSIAGKPIFPAL